MTDRRPGPPLFELLSQNQPDPENGEGSGRGDEVKSGESTGEPVVISAGVTRAERSAATEPEELIHVDSGLRVSMPRVYMLIALTGLMMVLIWASAYKAGVSYGKAQMELLIPDKPLVLPPVSDASGGVAESSGAVVDDGVGEPPSVPARATRAIMTAQGYREQDPRASGYNYLQLATVSAEQAADAILFMNDHSMAIIGVPVVDSGVQAGNNPSRYTLYSLGLAVPGGGEFRAMEAQRREHKRVIAGLGTKWQRERRGGSDFGESKTQWVKYN